MFYHKKQPWVKLSAIAVAFVCFISMFFPQVTFAAEIENPLPLVTTTTVVEDTADVTLENAYRLLILSDTQPETEKAYHIERSASTNLWTLEYETQTLMEEDYDIFVQNSIPVEKDIVLTNSTEDVSDEELQNVTSDSANLDNVTITNTTVDKQVEEVKSNQILPDTEITVAVIDTGFDGSLKDTETFKDRIAENVEESALTDENGHGTLMARIIAKNSNAKILPIKVFNENGFASVKNVHFAIMEALEKGADIINLSANASCSSAILSKTIEYATSVGVPVVVSAGNAAKDVSDAAPANIAQAIVITDTNSENQKADYANFGATVDFSYDGTYVNDADTEDTTDDTVYTGTSISAANISAIIANTYEKAPNVFAIDPTVKVDVLLTYLRNASFGEDENHLLGYGYVNKDTLYTLITTDEDKFAKPEEDTSSPKEELKEAEVVEKEEIEETSEQILDETKNPDIEKTLTESDISASLSREDAEKVIVPEPYATYIKEHNTTLTYSDSVIYTGAYYTYQLMVNQGYTPLTMEQYIDQYIILGLGCEESENLSVSGTIEGSGTKHGSTIPATWWAAHQIDENGYFGVYLVEFAKGQALTMAEAGVYPGWATGNIYRGGADGVGEVYARNPRPADIHTSLNDALKEAIQNSGSRQYRDYTSYGLVQKWCNYNKDYNNGNAGYNDVAYHPNGTDDNTITIKVYKDMDPNTHIYTVTISVVNPFTGETRSVSQPYQTPSNKEWTGKMLVSTVLDKWKNDGTFKTVAKKWIKKQELENQAFYTGEVDVYIDGTHVTTWKGTTSKNGTMKKNYSNTDNPDKMKWCYNDDKNHNIVITPVIRYGAYRVIYNTGDVNQKTISNMPHNSDEIQAGKAYTIASSGDPVNQKSVTIDYGDGRQSTTDTKTYAFLHWNVQANTLSYITDKDGNKIIKNSKTKALSSKYKIKGFVPDLGVYEAYATAVWNNLSFALPSAPTRQGYYFTGWKRSDTGQIFSADAMQTFSPKDNGAVTYTAQWEPIQINLLYTTSSTNNNNSNNYASFIFGAYYNQTDAKITYKNYENLINDVPNSKLLDTQNNRMNTYLSRYAMQGWSFEANRTTVDKTYLTSSDTYKSLYDTCLTQNPNITALTTGHVSAYYNDIINFERAHENVNKELIYMDYNNKFTGKNTTGQPTEVVIVLHAVWNYVPTVFAKDKYYTYDQLVYALQNNKFQSLVLGQGSYASIGTSQTYTTSDKDDTALTTSICHPNKITANSFTKLGEYGLLSVPIQVVDNAGNESYYCQRIWVTNTNPNANATDGQSGDKLNVTSVVQGSGITGESRMTTVRYIDESNYNKSYEEGGLYQLATDRYVTSVWYSNDEYKQAILNAFKKQTQKSFTLDRNQIQKVQQTDFDQSSDIGGTNTLQKIKTIIGL